MNSHLVFSLASQGLAERRDWTELRPGIAMSLVYRDAETQASSAFLRYAAGAQLPLHRHPAHEHILVIEGSQSDDAGDYGAGTFVINLPGTSHRVWSANGCLVLLIWERPVVFEERDGSKDHLVETRTKL